MYYKTLCAENSFIIIRTKTAVISKSGAAADQFFLIKKKHIYCNLLIFSIISCRKSNFVPNIAMSCAKITAFI